MPSETEITWMTKPSDRFILRWIKVHLSSHITVLLVGRNWIKPWMITLISMTLGIIAGILFAMGFGFSAGFFASLSQIMDGVDGQFARLTSTVTRFGGFLDSVLDRYTDGFLVMGLAVFCLRNEPGWESSLLAVIGAMSVVGSSLISYTSSRAENLGIDLGRPTLASKGSRTAVVAISGLLSPMSASIPLMALLYLLVHTTTVVTFRIYKASVSTDQ
ncbi:MAG: CDP-alcohol phosphatidyltransferase family protein [Pseudomonadota bacterium]